MADSDIDDRALPDLHDYQLVRLVAGQNEAEATFQYEGDVVRIRVLHPTLVRFEGDMHNMYIDGLVEGRVDGGVVDGVALTEAEAKAVRGALRGWSPRRQALLKAIDIAGIDLLLMGDGFEIERKQVPYEEPEVTPEEQARHDAIHAMLTGVVASHGPEGLWDPKIMSAANRKRGRKR